MARRRRGPIAGRIIGAETTCDHGRRAATCMLCLVEMTEDMDWDRAVDEDRHRVSLMGYDRPCHDTAYLDLLADLEPARRAT